MDVWERLGIEKTDDERAIKRAYAKKLKTIRPDEDPKHFQTLREARDEAIYLAKYDFDYDYDWEEEETSDSSTHNEENLSPTVEPSIEEQGSKNLILERALDDAEPRIEDSYVLTLDEETVEQKPFKQESVSSQSTELNTTELKEEEAVISEASECSDPDISDISNLSTELDEREGLSDQLSFYETDIDDVTYEHLDDEIENLMGPWSLWDTTEWKRFVNRVRECSFDISNYAEYEILSALGDNLTEEKVESSYKRDARLNILYYLDEEYGWTQNDRRVYAILPSDQSEVLMDYLRHGEVGVSHGAGETYYDAFGFPLLTAEHFKDYLGKSDSVYERYYEKSLSAGKEMKPSWSWPGFLFSPLWLAHRCNDGLEALAGMFYIMALIVLHYGLTSPSLIASVLGILMIVSVHVIVGIYGRKLVVTTLASSLQDLQNDEKLNKEEKLKKLATIGRGGFKALFDFIVGMAGIGLIASIIYRLII
jgi:curved DNA-binding protein CbpA